MTSFEIKNKVAFVTGTNKKNGIGRAIVEALLAGGAKKVYATAREVAAMDDLILRHTDRFVAVPLDVTCPEQVSALRDKYTDVQLLVNNAGYATGTPVLGDPEAARREMDVNYFGPLLVTQALTPVLQKWPSSASSKGSAVVNINSIVSLVNHSLAPSYSASKAASHSLTQAQRRELRSSLVVGVYPGPIATEMTRELGLDVSLPPASQVAEAVLEALREGTEDVFPDAFSKELYASWKQDAKALEAAIAAQ